MSVFNMFKTFLLNKLPTVNVVLNTGGSVQTCQMSDLVWAHFINNMVTQTSINNKTI